MLRIQRKRAVTCSEARETIELGQYRIECASVERAGEKIIVCERFNRDALIEKISSNGRLEDVDGPYVVIAPLEGTVECDFLGIHPLFYSPSQNPDIAVSDELCKGMLQLAPSKRLALKGSELHFEERAPPAVPSLEYEGEEALSRTLARMFEDAVKERMKNISSDEKVGLMLSGGVDSSTLATALVKLGVKFTAYTVTSGDSLDLEYAKALVRSLGIPHEEVRIEKMALGAKMREVVNTLNLKEYQHSTPVFLPVISGLSAIYYFAFERASEQGVKWMLSGVGSEEIFAGFVDRTREALDMQCRRRLYTIYNRDLYRDRALAFHFGIRTIAPFLDIEFSHYGLGVPSSFKVREGYKKHIWRLAAERLGTPSKNCWRQNKATQYGSGVDRLVGELARESGLQYRRKYIEWLMNGRQLPSENIEVRGVELPHDWADVKRVIHLVLNEYGIDYKSSDVKDEISDIPHHYLDGGAFFVAVCNGRVIGTVAVRRINERECELKNMYLQRNFRGKGLGRRLLDAALTFAKERRFAKMRILTSEKFSDAHRLYERAGFTQVGRIENEWNDRVYEMKLA